jgi:hypothetical protein
MNLYGAEEFAHGGDCPGCAECEESETACQACVDGVKHDSCEPYFDDGSDDEVAS